MSPPTTSPVMALKQEPFLWSDCFKDKKRPKEVPDSNVESAPPTFSAPSPECVQEETSGLVVRTTTLTSAGKEVKAVSTLWWESVPIEGSPRCSWPFPFMQVSEQDMIFEATVMRTVGVNQLLLRTSF